jgi:hypothetical protein
VSGDPRPGGGELPHDDELDVEAPNESAAGHNPPDDDSDESEDDAAA